jgi:hypothetical protein
MNTDDTMSIVGIVVIVLAALLLCALWITPVVLGIRLAQRKGYSPHWMWFGMHPIGGWVAFIVMACLEKRTQCTNCGGFLNWNFRLCPHCGEPVAFSVEKKVEPQLLE